MAFVNLELPDAVAEALKRIAAEQDSTVEAVAVEAISDAIGADPALLRMIEAGESEIAAGLGVPHDDVMAEMRRWAADMRARHPAR